MTYIPGKHSESITDYRSWLCLQRITRFNQKTSWYGREPWWQQHFNTFSVSTSAPPPSLSHGDFGTSTSPFSFWQQRHGSAQPLQGASAACSVHSCPLGVLMRTCHLLCVRSRHALAFCSHSFVSVSVHVVSHRCVCCVLTPPLLSSSLSLRPPSSKAALSLSLSLSLPLVLLLSGTKGPLWNG